MERLEERCLLAADLAIASFNTTTGLAEIDEPFDYIVSFTNDGPDASANTQLSVTLPESVDFGGVSSNFGTCGESAGVVSCDFGTVDAGQQLDATITVTPRQPGTITASAEVSSDEPDGDASNNTLLHELEVIAGGPVPQLFLSVSWSGTANLGESINYSVNVNNVGDPATDFELQFAAPVGIQITGANPSDPGGNCVVTAQLATCEMPDLPPNQSTLIHVTAVGTATGLFDVTADARAAGAPFTSDGFNHSRLPTEIGDPIAHPFDWTTHVQSPDGPVEPDTEFDFKFFVFNDGPQPAPGTIHLKLTIGETTSSGETVFDDFELLSIPAACTPLGQPLEYSCDAGAGNAAQYDFHVRAKNDDFPADTAASLGFEISTTPRDRFLTNNATFGFVNINRAELGPRTVDYDATTLPDADPTARWERVQSNDGSSSASLVGGSNVLQLNDLDGSSSYLYYQRAESLLTLPSSLSMQTRVRVQRDPSTGELKLGDADFPAFGYFDGQRMISIGLGQVDALLYVGLVSRQDPISGVVDSKPVAPNDDDWHTYVLSVDPAMTGQEVQVRVDGTLAMTASLSSFASVSPVDPRTGEPLVPGVFFGTPPTQAGSSSRTVTSEWDEVNYSIVPDGTFASGPPLADNVLAVELSCGGCSTARSARSSGLDVRPGDVLTVRVTTTNVLPIRTPDVRLRFADGFEQSFNLYEQPDVAGEFFFVGEVPAGIAEGLVQVTVSANDVSGQPIRPIYDGFTISYATASGDPPAFPGMGIEGPQIFGNTSLPEFACADSDSFPQTTRFGGQICMYADGVYNFTVQASSPVSSHSVRLFQIGVVPSLVIEDGDGFPATAAESQPGGVTLLNGSFRPNLSDAGKTFGIYFGAVNVETGESTFRNFQVYVADPNPVAAGAGHVFSELSLGTAGIRSAILVDGITRQNLAALANIASNNFASNLVPRFDPTSGGIVGFTGTRFPGGSDSSFFGGGQNRSARFARAARSAPAGLPELPGAAISDALLYAHFMQWHALQLVQAGEPSDQARPRVDFAADASDAAVALAPDDESQPNYDGLPPAQIASLQRASEVIQLVIEPATPGDAIVTGSRIKITPKFEFDTIAAGSVTAPDSPALPITLGGSVATIGGEFSEAANPDTPILPIQLYGQIMGLVSASPTSITARLPDFLEPGRLQRVVLTTLDGRIATGEVVLAPSEGQLEFHRGDYVVGENGIEAELIVTRTGGSRGTLSALVSTGDGTALAGHDYLATTKSLVWGDGDTRPRSLTVPIFADAEADDGESLTVTLTDPTSGATLGARQTATVTISESAGTIAGRAFIDLDGSGTNDPDTDPGVPFATVFIDANGDDLLNNPVSGDGVCDLNTAEPCVIATDSGEYLLGGLTPGDYAIRVAARAGLTLASPASGEFPVMIDGSGVVVFGQDFAFADSQSPILVGMPAERTIETDSGSAIQWFTLPFTADNADLDAAVVCTPPGTAESVSAAGGTPVSANFPLGATTVTCIATDDSGNSTQASFVVTVIVDSTPPELFFVPGDISVPATNAAGTLVSFFSPSARDSRDLQPDIICASSGGLTSGATFPIGSTSVTCTATDSAGNASQQSFDVTVTAPADTVAPSLANVPSNATIPASAPSGAVFTYALPTATDNSDPMPTVACSPASGSLFPLGASTVTCTATDSAGNSIQASFTVTVVAADTTSPTITNLQLTAAGKKIGKIVLTFSEDVQNSSAPSNYQLATVKKGKIKPAPLASLGTAVYSSGAHTLTFTPTKPVAGKKLAALRLTVLGSGTIVDLAGNPLDGNGDMLPRGDCITGIANRVKPCTPVAAAVQAATDEVLALSETPREISAERLVDHLFAKRRGFRTFGLSD
jgi:hypothetical protein